MGRGGLWPLGCHLVIVKGAIHIFGGGWWGTNCRLSGGLSTPTPPRQTHLWPLPVSVPKVKSSGCPSAEGLEVGQPT